MFACIYFSSKYTVEVFSSGHVLKHFMSTLVQFMYDKIFHANENMLSKEIKSAFKSSIKEEKKRLDKNSMLYNFNLKVFIYFKGFSIFSTKSQTFAIQYIFIKFADALYENALKVSKQFLQFFFYFICPQNQTNFTRSDKIWVKSTESHKKKQKTTADFYVNLVEATHSIRT